MKKAAANTGGFFVPSAIRVLARKLMESRGL